MEYKRCIVVTSWSVTFFWVLLSLGLSILTMFSFLQADWIVKRNLIITNYYEFSNESSKNADELYRFPNSIPPIQSELIRSSSQDNGFSHFYHYQDNNVTPAASDIEEELLSNDEYFLYNDENYTILTQSVANAKELQTQRLVKVTKVLITIKFGILGICTSNPRFRTRESVVYQCRLYGEDHLHTISSVWPMVTAIGGSGCVTLCVSAVLSTLAVALPSSHLRYQVATTIGHAQTIAVGLLFVSLLIFPMGFDSEFVHYHCGSAAGSYNLGECEIGWAYALVLVCASLALYCPILVKFTSDISYEILPKYI